MNYTVVFYESGKHFYAILYKITNNSAPSFKKGLDIYRKLDMMYKSAINVSRKIVMDYYSSITYAYHIVNENQLSPCMFESIQVVQGVAQDSPIRYVTLASYNKKDLRQKMKTAFIRDVCRRLPLGNYSFIYYNDGQGLVQEKLIMTYLAEENGSFKYELI